MSLINTVAFNDTKPVKTIRFFAGNFEVCRVAYFGWQVMMEHRDMDGAKSDGCLNKGHIIVNLATKPSPYGRLEGFSADSVEGDEMSLVFAEAQVKLRLVVTSTASSKYQSVPMNPVQPAQSPATNSQVNVKEYQRKLQIMQQRIDDDWKRKMSESVGF